MHLHWLADCSELNKLGMPTWSMSQRHQPLYRASHDPTHHGPQALILSARGSTRAPAPKKKGARASGGGSSNASASDSSSDSLEHLAARSLHKLLALADATQAMGPLMALLPLPQGARAQQPAGEAGAADTAAAEVAAR